MLLQKKTLGFSLQIRPSIALVPTSDQSFDISSLGLDKISLAAGESPITPTISGSTGSGPELVINENGNEISIFNMPGGTGVAFVPAPIIQASLGLIKNTDITVRYLPEVSFDDYGSISIIGGAIKHGINQYIPAGKLLPVDLSIMFGFNQIGADANLSLAQVGTRDPNDPNLVSNPTPNFDNQQVTTQTSTYVVNVLAGKALPFISVYGGLGFQKASFDLTMEGDYPVPFFNPLTPGEDYFVIQDPVSFTIDSESNVHMLGGFRLRLGFIAFYGEATLANYFTANAGVGISFR